MTIPNKYQTELRIAVALVVATVFGFITGLFWPLLIATIAVYFFSVKGFGIFRTSFIARLLLALVVFLASIQFLGLILWFIHITLPRGGFLVLSAIAIMAYRFSAKRFSNTTDISPRFTHFGRVDIVLLIPMVLFGGLFMAKAILPSENDNISMIQSINYGMDDSTHLSMYSDHLLSNGNLVNTARGEKSIMAIPSHGGYPFGWHSATSIVTESFVDTDKSVITKSLQQYFYAKLGSLMLVTLSIGILVVQAIKMFGNKKQSIIEDGMAIVVTGFVTLAFVLPMFLDGFFSFMPVIIYANLFAALVIAGGFDPKNNSQTALLALLSASSAMVWILSGPILLLAYAFIILSKVKTFRDISWKQIIAGGIALLAFLAQAFIQLNFNNKAVNDIASPGGIVEPGQYTFIAILIALFVAVGYVAKPAKQQLSWVYSVIASFLLSLIGILAILSIKSAPINYYFYKIQIIPLVIAVSVALGLISGAIISKSSTLYEKLINSIILFCVTILGTLSLVGYPYIYNVFSRVKTSTLTNNDATAVMSSLSRERNNNNERFIFFYPNDGGRTILASNTARIPYQSTSCDYRLFSNAYMRESDKLVESLVECAPNLPKVNIYTDKAGEKIFQSDQIKKLEKNNEILLHVLAD